ncbi:YtzI protein [Lysinibacillus piscis]|uniref:YtzI protein n=1 Tax=Lysinibacillus piscis TaxID=2518931 RepID=A0ABQ5NIM6_9BACI|nr:YtzI protein [Lysinibacillus sp. KH24]GLC88139.1 hypothetical protein LYSBPC_12660 [Lysinibacillus sp. KH24]
MSLAILLTIAIMIVIIITCTTIVSINRAYAFQHTIDAKPKKHDTTQK